MKQLQKWFWASSIIGFAAIFLIFFTKGSWGQWFGLIVLIIAAIIQTRSLNEITKLKIKMDRTVFLISPHAFFSDNRRAIASIPA